MNSVKKEMRLFAIAGVIVILNIGAHLLATKMFNDFPMVELTLAFFPFAMLVLGLVGFRIAAKE